MTPCILLASPEFRRFLMVGSAGFVVDALVLLALVGLELSMPVARVLSFLAAVSVTWLLNRLWSFRPHRTTNLTREYAAYLGVQGLGAGVNFAVFFLLVSASPLLHRYPVAALAAASAAALLVNFLLMRALVFRGRPQD